jgi:hypothetical protein
MPHTDYTDPETTFPRLEVRIQKLEADAYGSYPDAHEFIRKCAKEHDAEIGPDDITSE